MGNLFSKKAKKTAQPPAKQPQQQPPRPQQPNSKPSSPQQPYTQPSPYTAQQPALQQQRGSASSSRPLPPLPQSATPPGRPLGPSPLGSSASSRTVSPPASTPHTPNTSASLPITALPTIPTLVSPLNGRAVSADADDSADQAASEEVSRADEPQREIEVDARVDSGGDAAYNFWNRSSRERTYRPPEKLNGRNARLGQTVKATMNATLGGGDIMETVKLPEGEDPNEWIAVNSQRQQAVQTADDSQCPALTAVPLCSLCVCCQPFTSSTPPP